MILTVKSLNKREQLVDTICSEGCKFVNQFLQDTQMQNDYLALNDLSNEDQQWVLAELTSIMSVYDHSGTCTL